MKRIWRFGLALLALFGILGTSVADQPRIVNIYNFIRNSDFRLSNSEDVLLDCTRRQIELLKQYHLPATWALQYDALINPHYQKLLKEQLGSHDEIAAWWEIPEPLAKKAGINWRGAYEWDPVANIGFSPGYTPAERRRLVDVYMADFKEVFGCYPKTVGSWFIDEVTLEYMAEQYGIVASCNCKDQIGTDFYTLWGGYWNQAYYPSRVNAYMPAQTRAGQIDVPVFRMLGSDPIYEHGTTPGLISLEPVYKSGGGGMPEWVDWFMDCLVKEPSLAFAYTQTGQENSFGWDAMAEGLKYQIPLLAKMERAGKIKVETLEQSGRWFRENYPLTPPTSVVALDDWKEQGGKTVWYNSRFYRLNILWEKDTFVVRDIHCFDESIVSPTYDTPLKETSLTYETLPVVDWAFWSDGGRKPAGMFPVLIADDGAMSPMQPDGPPNVSELNATDLRIVQPLNGGGTLTVVCTENSVAFSGLDGCGAPLKWAWKMIGGDSLESLVQSIDDTGMTYRHSGIEYRLQSISSSGSFLLSNDGSILMKPNDAGTFMLNCDVSRKGDIADAQ
ncbi:MAG: hypothetical protein JXR25_15705 [Pontiellaceae bacterium]|nr:hypothetical protein [Pontiellaceae bacterium]MBN2786266.1 hypothetical protein [Pontiellaceae bacterium]